MKHLIGAACGLLALAFAGSAWADNYSFTFSGERFAQGSVTGILYDLPETGSGTPSKITLFDTLPDYVVAWGASAGEADFAADMITGTFTASDGNIVSGLLSASNGTNDLVLDVDQSLGSIAFQNWATIAAKADEITEGGSSPVYSNLTTSAPEPGVWWLMLGGVALAGMALRRRNDPAGATFAA